MSKNSVDELAKKEFSHLNKDKYKQVNKLNSDVPNIYIISSKDHIIQNIKESAKELNYNVAGVSNDGETAIKNLKRLNIHLVVMSLNLKGKLSCISVGQIISKYNIPVIYVFDDAFDTQSSNFLMTNYGFIFEHYSVNEIKFALKVAIKKHYYNITSVQKVENRFREKNIELGIEKLYSSLLLGLSILLIVGGILARNATFLQWILFFPAVFMAFIAIVSLKKQKDVTPYEVPPFVSLFIPAHNEEFTIENTVRSVASMDYTLNGKPNFEVIVINDGSEDKTGEILANLKDEFDNLRIITRRPPKSGKGKGFVLNDALVLAEGSIVGVFDADTRVEPDYLNVLIPYLNNPKVDGVQSRVRMYNKDENFLANMQDIEFSGFGNVLRAHDNLGFNAFLGGNGQFVKKDAIIKAGKWDGFAVTEDLNLSVKIALNKGGIRYCPDVAVYQEAVTDWSDLFRQRVRWAIGNFETLFIYSGRVVLSRLPAFQKLSILSHISIYAFNLFIFFGFVIFLINMLGWFVFGLPSLIRMDAPLLIGILSAFSFFPGISISLFRDDKKYVTFLKDLVGYWLYCFHLIPLFFRTMGVMILRRERKWDKTTHNGVKEDSS